MGFRLAWRTRRTFCHAVIRPHVRATVAISAAASRAQLGGGPLRGGPLAALPPAGCIAVHPWLPSCWGVGVRLSAPPPGKSVQLSRAYKAVCWEAGPPGGQVGRSLLWPGRLSCHPAAGAGLAGRSLPTSRPLGLRRGDGTSLSLSKGYGVSCALKAAWVAGRMRSRTLHGRGHPHASNPPEGVGGDAPHLFGWVFAQRPAGHTSVRGERLSPQRAALRVVDRRTPDGRFPRSRSAPQTLVPPGPALGWFPGWV